MQIVLSDRIASIHLFSDRREPGCCVGENSRPGLTPLGATRVLHCTVIVSQEKSAVSLRGIATDGLREKRHSVVLDHVQSPSQFFAAVLQDVIGWKKASIIAAARSEHMEDVGFLLPMFSDPSAKYVLRNFELDTATVFALQVAGEL